MAKHAILGLVAVGVGLAVLAMPPIPQPASYHLMADERSWLGIPNWLNVVSNLPFAIVGFFGMKAALAHGRNQTHMSNNWERWPYTALFAGVALTSVGSSYYHWAPDNARLVWDRLPMTVGFMGLLTAMFAERVSLRVGRGLFLPLLAFGIASVVYWYWSELQHRGDLRWYYIVQYESLLLMVLLLLLYPARDAGTVFLVAGVVGYAAAKGLEYMDRPVFAMGHIVSGHTLKHLVAAGAVGCLVAMLRARRRPAPS